MCISWIIKCLIHSTCFGCQPHPSSGVHKTVTTDSGTGHMFCAAASLQHSFKRRGSWKMAASPNEVLRKDFMPTNILGYCTRRCQRAFISFRIYMTTFCSVRCLRNAAFALNDLITASKTRFGKEITVLCSPV